jgi:hypothetical protein
VPSAAHRAGRTSWCWRCDECPGGGRPPTRAPHSACPAALPCAVGADCRGLHHRRRGRHRHRLAVHAGQGAQGKPRWHLLPLQRLPCRPCPGAPGSHAAEPTRRCDCPPGPPGALPAGSPPGPEGTCRPGSCPYFPATRQPTAAPLPPPPCSPPAWPPCSTTRPWWPPYLPPPTTVSPAFLLPWSSPPGRTRAPCPAARLPHSKLSFSCHLHAAKSVLQVASPSPIAPPPAPCRTLQHLPPSSRLWTSRTRTTSSARTTRPP